MQTTNYTESQIEDLRKKYKAFLRLRWIEPIVAIALFLGLGALIMALAKNGYFVGSYTFYDSQGNFHYISSFIDLVLFVYFYILCFGILLLWQYMFKTAIKHKLKDKYVEFEVAKRGENIEAKKKTLLGKIAHIFCIMVIIFFYPYFIVNEYNKINILSFYENSIKIKYTIHFEKITGTFGYDFFDDYELEISENQFLTGTERRMVRLKRDDSYRGDIYFGRLSEFNKYDEELLRVIDERTGYKHNYYGQLQDALTAD